MPKLLTKPQRYVDVGRMMTPAESKRIIKDAGGPTSFARLLGLKVEDGVAQRVDNWSRRGIPSSVILAHYETFEKLRQKVRKSKASA